MPRRTHLIVCFVLTAVSAGCATTPTTAEPTPQPAAQASPAPAEVSTPPPSATAPSSDNTSGPGELEPSPPFETTRLTLEGPDARAVDVPVYVADTPALRSRGLMGRERLDAGAGMIFVFEGEHKGTFWMKDTLIPLSIAFFDLEGEVVGVLDMQPCPPATVECPQYGPGVPYHSALEVNQGFFDEIGLTDAWRVQLPGGL